MRAFSLTITSILLLSAMPLAAESFDLNCLSKVTKSDSDSGYPPVDSEYNQTFHVDLDKSIFCVDACLTTYTFKRPATVASIRLSWRDPELGRLAWTISRTDGQIIGEGARNALTTPYRVVGFDTSGVCVKGPITRAPQSLF